MKQLTALLIAFSFSAVILTAQENSVYIGAVGGVNLSKFKYTQDLKELYSTTNSNFGLNGGVSVGILLGNWTISSGLQYIQKGGEYSTENFEDDFGVGFFTAKEKLHYLTVPLLFGYQKELADGISFSIAMGPSFNIGLSGKLDEEIEYFGKEDLDVQHYDIRFGNGVNDDYKSLQMGFQISPGLVFKVNEKSRLTFNVTWDFGLGDAFSERYKQANDFFDTYKGKQSNHSTIFTVGYQYHFSFGDRY